MRLLFHWPAWGACLAVLVAVTAAACSSEPASEGAPDGGPNPDGDAARGDGPALPGDDASAPADGEAPSKVDVTNETVDVDGRPRDYVLAVPKTYAASRSYPLVIAFHGDGFNGPSFRNYFRIDNETGDDAIVTWPTGNDWDLFTDYDVNNDQKLVEAVILAIKSKYNVDDAKIWGVGYSKGGFLASEIACHKPGLLKAMAIHAGGAPQEPNGANGYPLCPSAIGLPVLVSHGTLDPQFGGGDYAANYWALVAGCGDTRSATTPSPCQKHDGCPASSPVLFCPVDGLRHVPLWSEAAKVSWAFFTSL
ncbi:MAG: dienelactone hydrolase family protein [Labilithrix sp.]|nr:dienelactone hydrolase family protein [Labilithrix sp.]